MTESSHSPVNVRKLVLGFLISAPVGFVGGAITGAAILSFNVFLGQSGTTGEHFGDWNSAVLWLGAIYGAFFGFLLTPIAYVLLFRRIGFRAAWLPGVIGTLVGGLVGAFHSPVLAILFGVVGLFTGVWIAGLQHSARQPLQEEPPVTLD
jgi:hypothetical protein